MSGLSQRLRTSLHGLNPLQRIMLLNVGIFLVIRIINAISGLFLFPIFIEIDVTESLALPASIDRLMHKPWTIITYMFLHWEFFHLLSNMLFLYYFGRLLLEYLGPKKLVATYLLGGIAGGFFYILAFNTIPLFAGDLPISVAMGASASVMAITLAAATLLPDYEFSIVLLGPVRIKWIALAVLVMDVINISSSNTGGHIAHLGGALYGYLFVRFLRQGTDISGWLQRLLTFGFQHRTMRTVHRSSKGSDSQYLIAKKDREERLDLILDKISRSGYGSLSSEERDFLFKASKDQE